MQKYLIRFSYFGTNFRGLQVQSRTKDDYLTIQGILEAGLRYLRPANEPVAHTASRTDAGVHAFDNCLHVELLPRNGKSPYSPSYITHHLNTFLNSTGVDIRVKSTQTVSPAFDARKLACKRQYLYRIALFKEPLVFDDPYYNSVHYWPLPELERVFIVRKAVDMSKLIEGCALLQRTADFASFMATPAKNKPPPVNTVRNLQVSLSPGQPLMDASLDPAYRNLDFYNITFTSQSFLHNQIRRCVAVLLALAQGDITNDQVEHMFENPRPSSSPGRVHLSPACGLYLLKIDYPDSVLQPDYCGEEKESDSMLRWVDVRKRVRTMAALGHYNSQNEDKVVDKFCNVMRKLNDLRESLLKESVQMEGSESENEKKLSKTELENHSSNETKVWASRSEIDAILDGRKKRKMLDELYTLLMTRDSIDKQMRALMEPLIKANKMNKNSYDVEDMERAICDILETRRRDRERRVKLAGYENLYDKLNKKPKKNKGELESAQIEKKN